MTLGLGVVLPMACACMQTFVIHIAEYRTCAAGHKVAMKRRNEIGLAHVYCITLYIYIYGSVRLIAWGVRQIKKASTLAEELAGWLKGWLAGRLAGWLPAAGRTGWLIGWLAGWLARGRAGCLTG